MLFGEFLTIRSALPAYLLFILVLLQSDVVVLSVPNVKWMHFVSYSLTNMLFYLIY